MCILHSVEWGGGGGGRCGTLLTWVLYMQLYFVVVKISVHDLLQLITHHILLERNVTDDSI